MNFYFEMIKKRAKEAGDTKLHVLNTFFTTKFKTG